MIPPNLFQDINYCYQSSAVHTAIKRIRATVVGRFGITDVYPVVDSGNSPAKSVIGEVIPVSATVCGEKDMTPSLPASG